MCEYVFGLLLLTCMIGIGKFIKFKEDTQLDEIAITSEIGHNGLKVTEYSLRKPNVQFFS